MQDAAKRYLSAGVCVLPADRMKKCPSLGRWKPYQERLPTEAEIDAWLTNRPTALCLLTGKASGHLELLDFDHGGAAVPAWEKKLEAVAPGLLDRLVIETSQSGGWHVAYRCEAEICGNMKLAQRKQIVTAEEILVEQGKEYVEQCGKKCQVRTDQDGTKYVLITLIETRGEGGLFLCCPTPGYELVQGDFAQLPVLTEGERETVLRAAWELNEYWPEPLLTPVYNGAALPFSEQHRPGDDFDTRGDVRAVLRAHGWRPCGTRPDGNEHWTRPGKPFGTSATLKERVFYVFSSSAAPFEPNRAYSPFAVYALLEHHGDFSAAARGLATEGFGDALPSVARETDISGLANGAADAVEDDETEDTTTDEPDPGAFPLHLLDVPGFMGEMAEFISETNYTHQPVLSLAGALAFQGFLAGRKVCDPSNARTNVYVLGLAETCCGKERARTVCKDILAEHSEMGMAMFFERPASYQGVQKKVARQPQCLLLWDEIGQSLRAYRKADRSPHLQGILRTITEMYTSAGSVYCSDTHSDEKHDFTITQPNLVVYGTSTPDELFAGLTLDSIKNGFCGRMLLFEGSNDPEDVEQDESPPPPQRLVDATGEWLAFLPPGNNVNQVVPKPLVVDRSTEAKDVFGDLLCQQRNARRHDDPVHRALWGRAVQKASQLALIYACSKYGPNVQRLQIDRDAASWACEVVRYVTQRILYLASLWIADDDFHERQNEVLRYVRENGGATNLNKITRRFHRWPIRVRDEILQNLVATRLLREGKNPKTGRGTWYFVRRTVNEPSTPC